MDEATTSTFDAAGRLIWVSNPLSKVTSYSYDSNGNQTSVTDPIRSSRSPPKWSGFAASHA